MFRSIVYFAACIAVLGCAMPSHAQQLDCAYTFASAPGATYLHFCVSPTGTLIQLQTHPNDDLISEGYIGFGGKREGAEGYGLCNESPAMAYWDYLNDYSFSSNWNDASIVSSTAKSVKIARTTSDGDWTLTQTFTADTITPAVKLTMALKNNTKSARVAYLVRFAGAPPSFYNASSTGGMTFAWRQSSPVENEGDGLVVQNYGAPKFGFMNSYVWLAGAPSNPCDFAAHAASEVQVYNSTGELGMAYVGSVAARQTKTATIIYKGMF